MKPLSYYCKISPETEEAVNKLSAAQITDLMNVFIPEGTPDKVFHIEPLDYKTISNYSNALLLAQIVEPQAHNLDSNYMPNVDTFDRFEFVNFFVWLTQRAVHLLKQKENTSMKPLSYYCKISPETEQAVNELEIYQIADLMNDLGFGLSHLYDHGLEHESVNELVNLPTYGFIGFLKGLCDRAQYLLKQSEESKSVVVDEIVLTGEVVMSDAHGRPVITYIELGE